MANKEHVERLKQGVGAWNAWRRKDPGEWCDLSEADLRNRTLIGADLSAVDLSNANLRRADLSWANLREACLIEADLIGADLRRAELDGAHFSRANLRSADLRWAGLHKADLQGANLYEANLRGAELIGADLQGANLYGATLMGAKLIGASLTTTALVRADLAWADLTGCRVYGVSAWGLKLDGAKQQNLIITAENEPEITVDNIEVAQFIYLLLNNQKIRDVIDTITSKAVLILGRFTLERKAVLDALREELRKRDLLADPVRLLGPSKPGRDRDNQGAGRPRPVRDRRRHRCDRGSGRASQHRSEILPLSLSSPSCCADTLSS